ncbi:MAG: hypothetical protein R2941_17335 [Desulfobacterales bacterium]
MTSMIIRRADAGFARERPQCADGGSFWRFADEGGPDFCARSSVQGRLSDRGFEQGADRICADKP